MGGVSDGPPVHPVPPADPGVAGAEVIQPGMLTALLREMVATPEASCGTGWKEWLASGAVVGRFELIREIGRGGFGVVWEARDRTLGRRVAFKAVRAGTRAAAREERLVAEAEAAAQLSHPNLVTLHDVGSTEQGPYLVYELLDGETLEQRLRRGPMVPREAVAVAVEIARGVAHAHGRGVFHRDLKPANVMLCADGQVKVLDFGLAHAFGWHYEAGGTPAYMAPEQQRGAPEDQRADVFALGAILYRMLAGRIPYPADGDGRRDLDRPPEALDVPAAPGLAGLVGRMLQVHPGRRPRDGAEVLQALAAVQRELEEAAAGSRRPGARWQLAAGLLSAVLLGMGMTSLALAHRTAPDRRLLVAVADFANETRDPDLDGLSGLLITSLEQSRTLRVLTRARMIDLLQEMGQGAAPRIDEPLARALGRRGEVAVLLLASIRRLGDTYVAELRALDPRQDTYLFTLSEQAASKGDLLPLIDRISDRARLSLREPDAEVRATELSVAEAVTPSLEAYRHYFLGKDLAARGRLDPATEEYAQAVAVAPDFALARLELAWVGYFSGARSQLEASRLVREASVESSHAPSKEAGLIRALGAFFAGQFAASRSEMRVLTARYSDDPDLAVMAAEILDWCGAVEEALPFFERALRLAPDWDVLRLDQVRLLYASGRGREARALVEGAARRRGTPLASAAVALARYEEGDVEGGLALLRSSGSDLDLVRLSLAFGLAARGRIPEALAEATEMGGTLGDIARAHVLAHAGRLREGLADLDRAGERPGTDYPFNRQVTARYLAAAGDLEGARRAARWGDLFTVHDAMMLAAVGDRQRLAALIAETGADTAFNSRFLRALAAIAEGRWPSALPDLRAADRRGVSFAPFYRGWAAAEAGLDAEAVEALGRFEGPLLYGSDGYEAPWLLARARYLRARSLERLGRRAEALREVDLQLERWAGADPDLPLLAELRALRARLGEVSERR